MHGRPNHLSTIRRSIPTSCSQLFGLVMLTSCALGNSRIQNSDTSCASNCRCPLSPFPSCPACAAKGGCSRPPSSAFSAQPLNTPFNPATLHATPPAPPMPTALGGPTWFPPRSSGCLHPTQTPLLLAPTPRHARETALNRQHAYSRLTPATLTVTSLW